MIIFDSKTNTHFLIEGEKRLEIKANEFSTVATKESDEIKIKEDKDKDLIKKHIYIHIFSKPTTLSLADKLDYIVWCGDINTEPKPIGNSDNWWEPDTQGVFAIKEEKVIDTHI